MNMDMWDQLEKKGEVTRCIKCGKKIWIYWHVKSNLVKPMDKCGPCLSKAVK